MILFVRSRLNTITTVNLSRKLKKSKSFFAMVQYLYRVRSNVSPALPRLAFHDCFVEGCDATILLDPTDEIDVEKEFLPNKSLKGFDLTDIIKAELDEACPGIVYCAAVLVFALGCDSSVLLDRTDEIDAEKESPHNETLKAFDLIDIIKADLEEACPGIVSCADVLVLAANEGVALAGGPFYPLHTGMGASTDSFDDVATYELPSTHQNLSETIASFISRGFSERETVSLLGPHGIGVVHCKIFENRLYNLTRTDEPDPLFDTDFLNLTRARCKSSNSHTPSSAPCFDGSPALSPKESRMEMDYEGSGSGFGTRSYRCILEGKGILYADQQLFAGEEIWSLVREYASDGALFHRDFAQTMMRHDSTNGSGHAQFFKGSPTILQMEPCYYCTH